MKATTMEDSNFSISHITSEDVWVPTTCRECFYGCCIIKAHRVNGKIVKLEGDPNGPQNEGRICAKGLAGVMSLYDPNRIKTPLKRTNPEKGVGVDPKWVEISWDEALNTIAEKLKSIRAKNPKSFLLSSADINSLWYSSLPFKAAFGAPYFPGFYGGFFVQCGPAQHTIGRMYHDAFLDRYDTTYCKYLIISGTSIGFESAGMGVTPSAQRMSDGRIEKDMKLVVIDPRCSVAASKADEWIPIRPNTDLAFYLSMLNVLLNELQIYDAEFIKNYTNGPYLVGSDGYYVKDKKSNKPLVWDSIDNKAKTFDSPDIKGYAIIGSYEVNGIKCEPGFQLLKNHVKQYTPEWASTITTVPTETIRRVTKEFAEKAMIGSKIVIDGEELPYRPVAINAYRGSLVHYNATHTYMALSLCMMVVGAYDVPGSNQACPILNTPDPFKLPAEDGVLMYQYSDWSWPPDLQLLSLYPTAMEGSHIAMHVTPNPEKYRIPYKLECLMLHYQNPFLNGGSIRTVTEAFKNIPLVVAVSVYLDEPMQFADIVLPEPHWLERLQDSLFCGWHEFNDGKGRLLATTIRQPVAKPLYNTKQVEDILIDLAERTGFLYGEGGYNDMWNKMGSQLYEAQYPWEPLDLNKKYKWSEILDRILKAISGPEYGLNYHKEYGFKLGSHPRVAPKRFRNQYFWPYNGRRIPLYLEGLKRCGDNLKGKLKEVGIEWDTSKYLPLPTWFIGGYEEPGVIPAEYDLYIISYKTAFNNFGTTAQNPLLMEIYDRDPYIMKLWINKNTAEKKGIANGDLVWVESIEGKIKLEAKLSECIHPEAIAMGGTFGHWVHPVARGKGACFQHLFPFDLKYCDPVSGAPDITIRVKVYKA